MKLSCENVQKIIVECLPEALTDDQKKLALDDKDVPGFVRGDGVRGRFLFDKVKLESHRANVAAMLGELPKQFRKKSGGGWSFLNACMTEAGEQWGEQRNVDELISLGGALGLVKFQLPRDMWKSLPGGMPYFSVDVE